MHSSVGCQAGSGVVEDEAEGVPAAGADGAHAVPDRARGPAARAAHRPVPGGEDQAVALLQGDAGAAGLRPRPLLDHEELAAGVVRAVLVQPDHDLQREDHVADDVTVQRVPVPAPVAQQDLGALALPGPVAHLHPLRDRKSTRLNSSHSQISYAVFCLKKKDVTPEVRLDGSFTYT